MEGVPPVLNYKQWRRHIIVPAITDFQLLKTFRCSQDWELHDFPSFMTFTTHYQHLFIGANNGSQTNDTNITLVTLYHFSFQLSFSSWLILKRNIYYENVGVLMANMIRLCHYNFPSATKLWLHFRFKVQIWFTIYSNHKHWITCDVMMMTWSWLVLTACRSNQGHQKFFQSFGQEPSSRMNQGMIFLWNCCFPR